MEANTPMSLRQMLEQMTTEQLDKMLHQELKEKPANAESVRLILDVLYQREKDIPIAVTPQMETAWKQYKQDTALLARQRNRKKQFLRSIIGIASTAAVFAVMVTSVLPKYVEADNFWGRMARWSSDFVEFFSPADNSHRISEYKFSTDHPGLQEIYDTVEQYGAGKHAVPMWVPEDYVLEECKVMDKDNKIRIYARLANSNQNITLIIDLYQEPLIHKYEKDETEIIDRQILGTSFKIMQNNNYRTVLWNPEEQIECTLATDCQEDVLYQILNSLFTLEVNQ